MVQQDIVYKPMYLIAAAAGKSQGIGKDQTLPWRLPKEFAYFTKMTSTTASADRRNAVVMGRATWESIPDKFRPLKNRLNVVISRTMSCPPHPTVLLFPSLDSALRALSTPPLCDEIDSVFNVGGAQLYQAGLEHPSCARIYLTRIHKEFDCDTFFPAFDEAVFKQIRIPEVPEELQVEKDIEYEFCVYEKQRN